MLGINPSTAAAHACRLFLRSLQHGLPGSLLVLLGLLIDLCCPDLHLHKKPAFEGLGGAQVALVLGYCPDVNTVLGASLEGSQDKGM